MKEKSSKFQNEILYRQNYEEDNKKMIDQEGKEYIELNAFVKKKNLATTGGQAKMLIRSGALKLNGIVETRNRKKLYDNDVIEYEGKRYVVKL